MRRTDKINAEAAFHSINEYMVHVEEWYKQLSLTQTVEQRRVFIATDEPTVIKEAKEKSDFTISLSLCEWGNSPKSTEVLLLFNSLA